MDASKSKLSQLKVFKEEEIKEERPPPGLQYIQESFHLIYDGVFWPFGNYMRIL